MKHNLPFFVVSLIMQAVLIYSVALSYEYFKSILKTTPWNTYKTNLQSLEKKRSVTSSMYLAFTKCNTNTVACIVWNALQC